MMNQVDSTRLTERKRIALERVLRSQTLGRSDQLRNFLRYVCELEIAGRGLEINEYLIGVEALGRPAGYSPGEDSSVRSRAYELRQKLQKYYSSECVDPDLRIELLKGSYIPRFVETAAPPIGLDPPPDAPTQALETEIAGITAQEASLMAQSPGTVQMEAGRGSTAKRLARYRVLISFLAGVLTALAIITAVLAWFSHKGFVRSGRPIDPLIAEAWGPLVRPDADVLICAGTNLFLIIRPFLPPLGADLPRYPVPAELYSFYRSHRPLPAGRKLEMHPTENEVAFGELQGILQASAVLREAGTNIEVLPEQYAPLAALRDRNVILFGISFTSQATTDLMANLPFAIDYDVADNDVTIRDRYGSAAYVPQKIVVGRYETLFGLITVLPTGNGHRTVIVSGITSFGSQGAMDYFASPESLRDLRRRFVKSGSSGFPSSYQVVVRCKASNLYRPCEYADSRIIRK